MANYIYGLPGDTKETIEETFNLSLKLCTSGWNTYAAMALPGSLLYREAREKGYELPKTYSGYSFHGYETVCLPTSSLKHWEVLKLRDEAYIRYHTNENFLRRIENKFGTLEKNNIINMSKLRLRRKIIEENI